MEDGEIPGTDFRDEPTSILAAAAQAGRRDAVEALFERYLPRVRQIVALRLGYRERDLARIEDLVQDALLRIFLKLDRYEQRSESSFRNWLSTCVANSVRNSLRTERSQRLGGKLVVPLQGGDATAATTIFPASGPGPSTISRGKEFLERVERALLGLEERDREAIILRRFCDMSYGEITAELGLPSEAAARKLVSRAIALLKVRVGIEEG